MLSSQSTTLSNLLVESILFGNENGIQEHKIKLLLSELTKISIPALSLNNSRIITSPQLAQFNCWLFELKNNKPVQYIVGKANFFGLDLIVNESVLIPRPESEGLVDWINSREKGNRKVLEIGTGSGAIALALKSLNRQYIITATDISLAALKIARINARRLNIKVLFSHADLFPGLVSSFDIIVSNPPYVSPEEYARLDPEVRFHEPKLALKAGNRGLEFYRRIIKRAYKYLSVKGKIYFETGENQIAQIAEIAGQFGFCKIEIKQDLAGKNRYLCISQ